MSEKPAIFLDANAGAPLRPEVVEALGKLLGDPLRLIPNPSSSHSVGRRGRRLMAEAKEKIALSLGSKTDPQSLLFPSSGTEANQWVVRSVMMRALEKGKSPHWITTSVEHECHRQLIPWVISQGGRVSLVPVDSTGQIDRDFLLKELTDDTSLVSLIWVNNETGVITDWQSLIPELDARKVPLHLDGAQAWGKLDFELLSTGASFVGFAAHKIGAPAGNGVLWVRPGTDPLVPVFPGKQQDGLRGGTENLLGIVATGAAASALKPKLETARLAAMRDELEAFLVSEIPGTFVQGKGAKRVGNTLNVSFSGTYGIHLPSVLDLEGFCISSGSACGSGVQEPSQVLLAMGLTRELAQTAVRISLWNGNQVDEVRSLGHALKRAVERARKSVFLTSSDPSVSASGTG